MTTRELLEETAHLLRLIADLLWALHHKETASLLHQQARLLEAHARKL